MQVLSQTLDEVFDRADALADSGENRYDAIRKVLDIDDLSPEMWAVKWQGIIPAQEWQQILIQHVATELENRATARRSSFEDFDDDYTPEDFEENVAALVDDALGAWTTIKYQDIDHVSRTLEELSRDWYATGGKDIGAGKRRIKIGEFKNEVHEELAKAEVYRPIELPEEARARFAEMADEVWRPKRRR